MDSKKHPIRLRYKATVAADGTGYVRSEILHRNRTLACQSLGFRNQTGARGNLELYIKQGEAITFIADQTSPASNRWYWYPYQQTIKEGEQIEAQQATCLASDVLDLHIIGYTTYKGEEVEE